MEPTPSRPSLRARLHQPRFVAGLQRHVLDAFVLVTLWLAMCVVAVGVFGFLANSLPGVEPLEPRRSSVVVLVYGLAAAAIAVIVTSLRVPHGPLRRRVRRTFVRARMMTWRLVDDVLGLVVRSWARAGLLIGAGVAAAVIAVALSAVAIHIPALVATAPPTDARSEAVANAPGWVPPMFFAIVAPVPEELMYRGPLLAVVAIAATLPSRRRRAVVVIIALVVTSTWFGAGHLEWSMLNAVTATAGGLLYGSAAIVTRSLWPAIIAHAVFNAAAVFL